MIHSLRHLLAMVIFAAAGMAYISTTALAQDCVIINGVKVVLTPTTVIVGGCNGGYGFSWPSPIPPSGPLNVPLTVDNITINGNHSVLGAIVLSNDPSRTPALSSIISNGTARFPATGTVRFFATATFSSQPGVIYTSATELVFVNNNLNQIFPFGNAVFSLQSPVVFTAPGYAPKGLTLPTYITLP